MKADRRVFAELIVQENGKCISEALGEIDYGLGFIEWYAEEAKRVYGDTIPTHAAGASVMVVKEAVGPTAAITPWNFPFMMVCRKIATALAAGCTMIIKPSEETPLTAYKLLDYARKAGIPQGVFEMVTGDPKAIGELFTGDTRIRKISFTGSTAVGKLLARSERRDAHQDDAGAGRQRALHRLRRCRFRRGGGRGGGREAAQLGAGLHLAETASTSTTRSMTVSLRRWPSASAGSRSATACVRISWSGR